ncbi:MAG: response regulator transcription factor [Candidatus Promineifilaceae bacterium]|nr:response regulator transcription factor [Candidatus Promineifilaceae bacterium]
MNNYRHILLIEDDPALANSLIDGLEQANFQVTWKGNGRSGIAYARDRHPHLIILDVRLPDETGFDVCRQLRQLKLRQPILMLTARSEEADKVLGLEMGADDYVTKPFSLRELLSRIRALLRRSYGELAAGAGNQLYAADLVIDQDQGTVWRGDTRIDLTPIELRLFTFLARHPGQALSRSQILSAVWGDSAEIENERTVNVHIRRLREKVELEPSQPHLILTVPGVGYRLAA